MISIVTAVSRPENLLRIHRSIVAALERSALDVKWIIVVDNPDSPSPATETLFREGFFEVEKIVHTRGKCGYGIAQKNEGIDSIRSGFFHCLDDDNLVHPLFFSSLEKAMDLNPSKRAFVVAQQRWDSLKKLEASPDRMEYGQIDNTMFVVHVDLIGKDRYDPKFSGREDYIFFRNLWNVHREDFVFINEPLAYYNYIRYFPAESPQEPVRQIPPPAVPVVRPPKAAFMPRPKTVPDLKASGVKKIALYSSKRDRCGISTYTSRLEEALISLGHDVRHWGSQAPYDRMFSEVSFWKPDVFHFQHETSIMPPEGDLCRYADRLRMEGSKVFITLHTENPDTLRVGKKAVAREHHVILHRPAAALPLATVIPMPCTVFGSRFERTSLRKKFRFPEDAFLVSTVGFMIPWKDHPKILEALIPWLNRRPDVHIQIVASEHFNPGLGAYVQDCRKQIAALASGFKGRIHHVDDYPGDLELIERLAVSDLGYVWCPFDTGSSSAAAAQFTTARCPLVATDSTHYAFLGTGIVRSPKDMKSFVELIETTAEDQELLGRLRTCQWEMYQKRNYIETALKHLELYGDPNGA